jgi:hypothetical protein
MSKSLYYLMYINNGERSELTLREPTLDSKDFIKIRGKRASELFNGIMSVIDAYALKYNILKNNNKTVVELPADIGYAVFVYLLLTYNVRKPKKWLYFLEKLLAGKVPLSKYLNVFISIAIDLSDLKHDHEYRETIIKPGEAKIVSSMMRILIKDLLLPG